MQGRVIANRYELVRPLGQGATGSVWLARDASGGGEVALKLASRSIASHPGTRARFLREAKLAANLGGPHIAWIHDHGLTDQGDLFVVVEYLIGSSLSEELAVRRRLTLEETLHVVSGVCAGLETAHQASVVHRDIKPQNVFLHGVQHGGPLGVVKILDFGSAKGIDWLGDPTIDPTRTGDMIGTPCYMSPEQAKGLTSIDFRADLWAVGVVAFECLTGVRAFEAPALGPLVAKILTGPPPVPSRAAPEARIPAEVDAWMARLLVRDPAMRPASAGAVTEAFAAAVQGRASCRPPLHRRATTRRRFASRGRRATWGPR